MSTAISAKRCLGTHDVLFITIDTLRYDVACQALADGMTPNLAAVLPEGKWQHRHSPSNFTYAAHQAFFAGFLPTPVASRETDPVLHQRLFAARFPGSETTTTDTLVFDSADIVSGYSDHGYRTICVGGVGFFNQLSALGSVLPGLFQESYWEERFGVTNRQSARHQVTCLLDVIAQVDRQQRIFSFINFSACHPPHHMYLSTAQHDSTDSQAAALADIDQQLGALFDACRQRTPTLVVICSDHGCAFGEGGYFGHRIGHPVVWEVPYAQFCLPTHQAVKDRNQ